MRHAVPYPGLGNFGRRFSDTDVFIRGAIVEKKSIILSYHSFHEYYVGNLPNFFPLLFWAKDWFLRAVQQMARVVCVEHGDAGAVHQLVVGPVIDQHNTIRCDDGWRAGLHHARIKFSRTFRQHWSLRRLGPMD